MVARFADGCVGKLGKPQRKSAITVIELLVVIAIIAILLAVTLPAVQAARESGRRTQCANHLKQIATAFHLHHDVLKAFPSGGNGVDSPRSRTVDGAIAKVTDQDWGWAYQILPFLEQESLWQESDEDTIKGSAIETYFCPSRRAPITFVVWRMKGSTGLRGQIDYAGCAGTQHDGIDGLLVRSNYLNGQMQLVKPQPVRLMGGVPDGTSNTLLLGERYLDPAWWMEPGGPEFDDFRAGYVVGMTGKPMLLTRSGAFQPARDRAYAKPEDYARFGSSHPDSFNAVFADGSLRRIRYEVSLSIFTAACRRNDGGAFSSADL